MPGWRDMDAAWWTALGAAARWAHSFTGAAHAESYDPAPSGSAWLPNWLKLGVSLGVNTAFYQAPFITGESDGGTQMSENNFDTGFFYLTDGHGDDRYPYLCAITGRPNQNGKDTFTLAQCEPLIPYNKEGELRPMTDLSGTPDFSAYYKTGFLNFQGYETLLAYSDTVTWLKCPARGEVATINHYAPFAWNGTPVEVVAAILLQMGLPIDYINQAAFTDAHSAYDNAAGDTPIDGASSMVKWFPQVFVVRAVGGKIVDLVVELMRHTRDLYFVDEAGVLAVQSFTTPLNTVASLTLADGVTDVEWSWSIKGVFNKVSAGWGSGYRTWGSPQDNPEATGFGCSFEEELDSFQDCKYIHEASNAASIAKYGEIRLKGRKRTTSGSKGKQVETAHYRWFLDPGCAAASWETYGFGGMMHVTNWLASDGKERRMITVVQDFRALDWGIGARLSNVAVTDDGLVVASAWCIEREYDFENLTITSLLMEQPANT